MKTEQDKMRQLQIFIRSLISGVATILVFLVLGSAHRYVQFIEERKIWQQAQQYLTAMAVFELLYDYLPGDHPDAFGQIKALQQDCTDAVSLDDLRGCNGNNDGKIAAYSEEFRVWHHLSKVGLVNQSYKVPFEDSEENPPFIPSINVPVAPYSKGFFRFIYFDDALYQEKSNGIMFQLQKDDYAYEGISAKAAMRLEHILDDNHPLKGNIYGVQDERQNCYQLVNTKANSIIYNPEGYCRIFFRAVR